MSMTINSDRHEAFSKGQITWLTGLFGPLAGVYFLKKNFETIEQPENARQTALYGILLTVALALVAPFLPDMIPGVVYAIAYALTARTFYEQKQEHSLESIPRPSNWKALGIAILCFIILVVLLLCSLFLYTSLGIIDLDIGQDQQTL